MAQLIERAFRQLHQVLCLIEHGATQRDIERAERSYQRTLQKLDVSERELVRHYPKYRFAVLARAAAATQCSLETGLETEVLN
jgi:hypothetical protein